MPSEKHKWYIDHTSPATAHIYGIENYITSFQTEYQQVEIADTEIFGRILFLDGKVQSAESDEYIYHEALVHPAMLMHPAPRRVLVIGGGEGATLREALKYQTIEHLIMVDLDRQVVEHCREYLKSWHQGSFDDRRVTIHYMDARAYLEQETATFDVIISDVPEPVEEGPALKLFTTQYFKLIKDRLSVNGLFALQAGDTCLPFIESHSAINNTLNKVMPFAMPYRAFVPSYNTEWGFILSAPFETALPAAETFDRLVEERKLNLQYFDGETARAMFAVPKDMRKHLNQETRVIDDDNLISIY